MSSFLVSDENILVFLVHQELVLTFVIQSPNQDHGHLNKDYIQSTLLSHQLDMQALNQLTRIAHF